MPYASLMPYATAAFVGGLIKAVSSAEAKKLTLLARYNAVSGKNRDALNVDEDNPKHGVCSVCIRRVGTGLLSCVKLRWCRVCGIAVCSKCRVKGKRVFLGNNKPHTSCVCCPNCAREARHMAGTRPTEAEYAVVADYFMESFWESEPQAEDATLFSIPLQWAGPVKEPIAAFCDWKQHRPGPVAAQNWNSSLNWTSNSSFNEDHGSVEGSSKESIMELSDDDTNKFRFASSSDEGGSFYVFYSPVLSSMQSGFGLSSHDDNELENR